MSRRPFEMQASEISELFGVSKSTLFRWEFQSWMPTVPRDASGARTYRPQHVAAIARFQISRLEPMFRHATATEDKDLMKRLFADLTFRKLLSGDITGLSQMVSRGSMDEDTIRDSLIWLARAWSLKDPGFADALDIIARQCKKLAAEENRVA